MQRTARGRKDLRETLLETLFDVSCRCGVAGKDKCNSDGCEERFTYDKGLCYACSTNCQKCDSAKPQKILRRSLESFYRHSLLTRCHTTEILKREKEAI